ncbi:MAG: protein deglycase HchA [Candidatus Marinimicrobia bacterium]|nr:protein deglycase HchA [Candidatus Neomarinimicrobiota bacterium]
MFKKLLGIAPKLENDGSYSPSKLALKLAVPAKTDYENISYQPYQGKKSKIVVVFTEQKNMTMQNDKMFSTGNHPVEAILPMLHLKKAGFEFNIVTPNGKPVVFEMWAMPSEDENVINFYNEYKNQFENPGNLQDFVDNSLGDDFSYAAVFVPGGHGAMLGIPEDDNVGKILHWAHDKDLFTITLCHGPGSLLSTKLNGNEFIYKGYQMTVFPDSVDKQTPMIGYIPGHMPWKLNEKLIELGAVIVNKKSDKSTHIDRKLITGASPLASNELGKLAANTLLKELK